MPTKIDEEKCIGCQACVSVCPATPNVYEMQEKNNKKVAVVKNMDACIDCGACITSCPVQAISMTPK
jgi:ferredoxin